MAAVGQPAKRRRPLRSPKQNFPPRLRADCFNWLVLFSSFCEYDEVGGIWGDPAEVGLPSCGRPLTLKIPTLNGHLQDTPGAKNSASFLLDTIESGRTGRLHLFLKWGVNARVGRKIRVEVLGGDLKKETVSCEPQNDFIFHLKKSF